MASKSLGPFPKTLRWREIVHRSFPHLSASEGTELSDKLLQHLKDEYRRLTESEEAIDAIVAYVSLPINTRATEAASLPDSHGPEPAPTKAAHTAAQVWLERHKGDELFPVDAAAAWRQADGSDFCDFARIFFTELNAICMSELLPKADPLAIHRFAEECSLITRSFSARWFNACARYETPARGSIKWYFGHCLGKLDLELSREMSDWIEPTGNPWKRRRKPPEPALDF
jgi:hypothetical protein